ncbi:PIN2/TERF1-interacting telomerase inhibitor 1-like [Portunus trituberculatus]|uniref:PIN2/TERF1-interacting telomerase inhibitor 1-like n=1 Tax=Portunus trituberculatus TaxID=210409 RepID=UPI001E1D05B1|nr:PIN2/TERF1-interacting telomerase inhibitor 1-like [Portunus trituberculatus]
MSMAEPRRRQKWSLNPRGSLWANDDSKFGQKLMEKMGWSKGHGLGREQQGMKDPLSVKLKDDSKGIGYKGSDDEWIKHYEDFENVLANLNRQDNTPTNGTTDSSSDSTKAPTHSNVGKTSLESSSKASRSRVHYHKFTRGKDLSRCTEDDLGCILGSKRAKQLAKEKHAEAKEENDVDEVGHVNHSMGLTTIKGCFMQDYFAQKMEAFRNRAKSQPQTVAEESQCDDEEEDVGRPGLGMNAGGGDLTPDSPNGEEENREERRKKKKKKKKHQVEIEEIDPAETISEKCCVEVEENNVPKKKKKKKKQKSSDFNDTDENPCEANGVEVSTEDTAQINPVVDEETQRKKKKKKKHSDAVEEQILNDETEEQLKVKKKKKRKHAEVTDEYNPSQCLAVEENNKKKKKKLKDKE